MQCEHPRLNRLRAESSSRNARVVILAPSSVCVIRIVHPTHDASVRLTDVVLTTPTRRDSGRV